MVKVFKKTNKTIRYNGGGGGGGGGGRVGILSIDSTPISHISILFPYVHFACLSVASLKLWILSGLVRLHIP